MARIECQESPKTACAHNTASQPRHKAGTHRQVGCSDAEEVLGRHRRVDLLGGDGHGPRIAHKLPGRQPRRGAAQDFGDVGHGQPLPLEDGQVVVFAAQDERLGQCLGVDGGLYYGPDGAEDGRRIDQVQPPQGLRVEVLWVAAMCQSSIAHDDCNALPPATHRAQGYDLGDDGAHAVAEVPHRDALVARQRVRRRTCMTNPRPLHATLTFKSMMLMCLYTMAPRRRLMSPFSRLMASNSWARWSSITSRGRRLDSSSAQMSCRGLGVSGGCKQRRKYASVHVNVRETTAQRRAARDSVCTSKQRRTAICSRTTKCP